MTGRATLAPAGSRGPDAAATPTEDLLLRNYDGETGHTVTIRLASDGQAVFQDAVRLSPGETRSVMDAVAPGRYEVDVRVDGGRTASEQCRIGPDLAATALVELGNGIVSITPARD